MDFAASLSVVQTLSAAIRCAELMEVCTVLGKNSELDHFSSTVCDVKHLLLDAKARQEELSHEARLWLEELKVAVYDADDLLDEFVILAEQKTLIVDGQASEEVRLFFTRFHPLAVSDYMSIRVKKIRESLDVIVDDNDQCRSNIDCVLPVRRRKEKICSYVYADDNIIGREDDLIKIVGMLLDSNVQQDVSFLSIVGVGGIGKTALARLVYNDERVTKAFPLRLWTCVSDQDQKQFDVDEILGKIVRSAIGYNHNGLEMGLLDQLMEQIEGRKYLLVLDDVWTENRDQWLNLVEVLMAGKRGSRIVVTTRLRETAEALGADATYDLQGLSLESSWRLFGKMAFEEAHPPDNLVRIGKGIVKGCHSNPLAVRVVGSLLYGQDESKWLYQDSELAKIRGDMNDIKPILKLSYHHLESALQSCFSYCALFPKDFEIEKDLLVSLWISQGFVVPFKEGQTADYAGEEYFSTLLERCFFQDVQKDENGDIVSCKMHDLMHDVAQELAGEEITAVGSVTENLHKRVIHLSGAKGKSTEVNFSAMTQIRTYFQVDRMDKLPMDQLIDSCISLRTLVLRNSAIKNLPDSIDKLLHMRCLDLSDNSSLEVLPNSITKLFNLQSLRLRSCIHLKELPKDISKLANLRVLDITYCYRLVYVPSDLHRLTCLHTLSNFTVSAASSSSNQCFDQLEGLRSLVNLKGYLWIKLWFPRNGAYVKEEGREGAFLKNKEHLKHVRFDTQHSQDDARDDYDTALVEDLQPHSNLKGIVFSGYSSMRLPSWAVEDNLSAFLPNLVRLEFVRCMKLVSLPCLGKLHHLKFLSMYDLPNLEYVEIKSARSEPGSSTVGVQTVFPCLEELGLSGLPKLIGWRKDVEVADDISEDSSTRSRRKTRPKKKKSRQLPFFLCLPQLKSLQIRECLELTSNLICPRLENLTLRVFNKKLSIKVTSKEVGETGVATTSSASSPSLSTSDPEAMRHPKLLSVITDNIVWLNTLPTEAFQCLSHICIYWDKELESLSEVEKIFRSCSTSLRNLEICHCPKLISLSGGLEHLTVLETLVLEYIANLSLTTSAEEERKQDGMPWRSLHQSLRSLELSSLPKILKLPKGMQYLTSLRSLKIYDCQELKFLPQWTQELGSLKQLDVQSCHHLCETCENLLG